MTDFSGGGQHHFPECCLITKEDFENIVGVAKKILSEKTVDPQNEGLAFEGIPVIYYKE